MQNCTETSEWWWTESENNAADIVIRPTKLGKLDDHWKHGPEYLTGEIPSWPIRQERNRLEDIPDILTKTHLVSLSTTIIAKPNLSVIEIM